MAHIIHDLPSHVVLYWFHTLPLSDGNPVSMHQRFFTIPISSEEAKKLRTFPFCSRGKSGHTYSRAAHTFVMVGYNTVLTLHACLVRLNNTKEERKKEMFHGKSIPGFRAKEAFENCFTETRKPFFLSLWEVCQLFFLFFSFLLASRVTITYRRDE